MTNLKKTIVFLSSVVLVSVGVLAINAAPAMAAKCGNAVVSTKSIGVIQYKSLKVAVKPVSYNKGGILEPPATTELAFASTLHAPLSSTTGSSLVVWHVDKGSCLGKLNPLSRASVGEKVIVTDEKGVKHAYKVKQTARVIKGTYKKEWFLLSGPRQIVFVTCAGTFKNGHHIQNQVVIAVPA